MSGALIVTTVGSVIVNGGVHQVACIPDGTNKVYSETVQEVITGIREEIARWNDPTEEVVGWARGHLVRAMQVEDAGGRARIFALVRERVEVLARVLESLGQSLSQIKKQKDQGDSRSGWAKIRDYCREHTQGFGRESTTRLIRQVTELQVALCACEQKIQGA
jgi:hypothetical protein